MGYASDVNDTDIVSEDIIDTTVDNLKISEVISLFFYKFLKNISLDCEFLDETLYY